MTVKRYDEHPDGGGMREDVLGAYVKFDDVKDEIARLKSALDIADREYVALSEELAQAAEQISDMVVFQVKDFNGSWSDVDSGDTAEWQARGRVVRQLIDMACIPASIANGDLEKWLFSHPEKDAEMEQARLSLYAFRASIAKAEGGQ
ncbi:hypothetical protein CHY08_34155 (plasmid) [Rhizobium leguminosarum bv. viciae]|uniref:hypothetical protein n=1 Tax=Rhizobium leguminosarum TaxID=384 RepID=UPI000B8CD8D5|nr:hypothetical protein [Rhizobium leguminosarum]ASR12101.1 hypothetical protein CHY08_34155 [Rhizobium leguminosarum bv. viciae]